MLNRTWETVKRVGKKKSVSADGKTVVTFVCLLASFLVTVLINSQCSLRASMFVNKQTAKQGMQDKL